MNKKNKKKLYKIVLLFIFASSLILGGRHYLKEASSINLNLPFKTYKFEISVQPLSADITDFILNFDFSKKTGNISFKIGGHGGKNLDIISIKGPPQVDFVGYYLINKSLRSKTTYLKKGVHFKDRDCSKEDYTCLVLNAFMGNISGTKTFFMKINGTKDMIPNGYFIIDTNRKDNAYINENGDLATFKLGDYECKSNCFIDYSKELYFFPEGDTIRIKKSVNSEKRINLGDERFVINTENELDRIKRNEKTSLGISLIVAGLILFINAIIEILMVKF